jgi:L-threonylcarbamoyladenylate synthase
MAQRLTTRVLVVDPDGPDVAVLETAASVLLRGGLVAFATETVYGLGAIATDPAAVQRIFAAKGRLAINPVIVHVNGIVQARECVAEWTEDAECLARRFWPGPMTLVLERALSIPDVVTAGRQTVAVRSPVGAVARGLIDRTGKPIAAPSANRSNRLSPTRAEHVMADLAGAIDLVIDSGPTDIGLESTVLDLTTARPRLLRPGPVSITELEQALAGRRVVTPIETDVDVHPPSSPGQMPVHYAPRTPSFRIEPGEELGELGRRGSVAVVVVGEQADRAVREGVAVYKLYSPLEAARRLYEVLHQCDSLGVDAIVVVMPPTDPQWQAIRDRLVRATLPLEQRG